MLQFGQIGRQIGRIRAANDETKEPPDHGDEAGGEGERQQFPALIEEGFQAEPIRLFQSGKELFFVIVKEFLLQPHERVESDGSEDDSSGDG